MVARIDLRVHVGAPSSRKYDDRFTAQAEAYRHLQRTRTHTLLGPQSNRVNAVVAQSFTDDAVQNSLQDNAGLKMPPPRSSSGRNEATSMIWDPTTFLEETQLGYTALESQLITSVLPVSKTPRKVSAQRQTPIQRRLTLKDTHTVPAAFEKRPSCERQLSLTPSSSPPRSQSQSSYLKSPVLDRANKRARAGHHTTLRTAGAAAASSAPSHIGLPELHQPNHVSRNSKGAERTLQHSEELSTGNDTTSELPTSYSLSNITTDSSRSGQQSVQRSISDPGPLAQDTVNTALETDRPVRSIQPPPSSNRPEPVQVLPSESRSNSSKQVEQPQQISPIVVKDFASITREPLKATTVTSIAEDEAQILVTELPDTIAPPSPMVSIQPLASHITHPLRLLIDKPDIAGRYEPVTQTRDLRDTERGYWLLDISTWSATLQLDFFKFLTRMIGEGRVGWGVWCIRDAESATSSLVRVYCWGEVVRHIYLLLYAASKSKVRRLGLQWIDAAGEVVVQMRGPDPG